MRYFITGGAGFIGSNYVRGLLSGAWGDEPSLVTVFDSYTYAGNPNNLIDFVSDSRLSLVTGDIRLAVDIDAALPNHDIVVHFAAESHVDRSIESSSVFVSTNVLGTQQMLEGSLRHGVKTFVHVSTDEVYGSIVEGSWNELEPLLPNSPYAASKAASDLLARAYSRTYELDVRITRCSNNYGTHQFPEKVIPLFVTNLIDGLKVPVYGDGLNIRDWLHVDDHCRAIQLVADLGKSGEIYNIGGGTELTNRELTTMILGALGYGEEMVQEVPDRLGHDRRYSVDWSKIQHELGYRPLRSLHSDIGGIVNWYRENESWWRPLKLKI
jgi:dTDP-glucose 4,6-dehydratase